SARRISSRVGGSEDLSLASTTTPLAAQQAHFLAPLACEEVDPVREAHPVAARAHHEGVDASGVREEADAAQEVAVRDAGRGDDHLAGRELLGREDASRIVDAELEGLLDFAAGR